MSPSLIFGFVVAAAVCAAGVAWRVTRGPGRRPLGTGDRLAYRGSARGVVERIDPDGAGGGTATVRYAVGGREFRVRQGFRAERRRAGDQESPDGLPTRWWEYETTSLGDIEAGGTIGVRYAAADPSRAVLVPNGHDPYGPGRGPEEKERGAVTRNRLTWLAALVLLMLFAAVLISTL